MSFPLKKVLKALLLSSSEPLSIKDIQAVFMRFHDQAFAQANALPLDADVKPSVESPGSGSEAASGPPPADSEIPSDSVDSAGEAVDDEIYREVPALITATQIREAADEIARDLRSVEEGLLLIEGSQGYRLVTTPRFARWVRVLRSEPPPVKLSQSSVETLAVVAYRQPVTRGEIETIRGVSAEAGINKLIERELIYIVGRADLPGRPIQYGTTDAFLEFVGVKSLDELPASDVLSSRQIDEWLKNSSSAHQPSDTDMGLSNEELPLGESAGEPSAAGTVELGAEVPGAEVGAAELAATEARNPGGSSEPASGPGENNAAS